MKLEAEILTMIAVLGMERKNKTPKIIPRQGAMSRKHTHPHKQGLYDCRRIKNIRGLGQSVPRIYRSNNTWPENPPMGLPFIMTSEEESPMGADSGGPGEAFLYDAGRIWRVDS